MSDKNQTSRPAEREQEGKLREERRDASFEFPGDSGEKRLRCNIGAREYHKVLDLIASFSPSSILHLIKMYIVLLFSPDLDLFRSENNLSTAGKAGSQTDGSFS